MRARRCPAPSAADEDDRTDHARATNSLLNRDFQKAPQVLRRSKVRRAPLDGQEISAKCSSGKGPYPQEIGSAPPVDLSRSYQNRRWSVKKCPNGSESTPTFDAVPHVRHRQTRRQLAHESRVRQLPIFCAEHSTATRTHP